MANTNTKMVKIGVFMPSECQLLDMACVDVLFMMSREYLGGLPMIPKHIPNLAPSVEIYYISAKACPSSSSNPGSNPTPEAAEHLVPPLLPLTAGVKIQPTHDVSSPEVQPGMLDILLVPGPDPAASWDEETLAFLRGHADEEGEGGKGRRTDVLSVCTGAFLCGAAGILEGRRVCGPRGLQDVLKKRFPGASCMFTGGITNGNDLVVAYARSSERRLFPGPTVEIAYFVNSISTESRQKAVYEWRVLTVHKSAGEDVGLGIFGAFLGKGPMQLLPQTHLPCRCALVAMVR
ncbi:ThiJ/PfpI family protein [Colletotrichum simmondsii]|uniref:ThiJ/PfpI family protein n=1 Tax=Colletotrichum simmondsii TaxID=703756 RepID=A0A135SNW4_9PEZI|nr:ThiJ/PfpI family protein [Colletotrichum simmondsii]